ncbi:MAG: outer membrane protein assembly factor [Cyclobacteriaceae bacterium]|nr:BamA/TamA family outer membrane protein [Cyclobacteriaceae bacterium]MCH8516213.1 outer membrane protein assembly factor [Cyclobacteriaceae bacterium]
MQHFFTVSLFFYILIGYSFGVFAQEPQTKKIIDPPEVAGDSVTDKNTIFPIPMVYYNPEAGLVYGVTTLYNFYIEREKPINPSQIQPAVGHTTKNQFLVFMPFQLFWNNNHNFTYGDINYFRFSYNFFGIGNDSDPEEYTAFRTHFFRTFANYTKKINPTLYAGFRFWYEDFSIGDRWHVIEDDDFNGSDLPARFQQDQVIGARYNRTLGLGGILISDKRDNVYYPMAGHFAEVFVQHHDRNLGSTHTFTTISADISAYHTFFENTVFAANLFSVFNFGEEVPFNRMAQLGGNMKMRGYYQGFLTDNHALSLQAEIRQMIWWRIGAAVFASTGKVADQFSDFGSFDLRFAYGGGLRFQFDTEKKVNLRFDYGISPMGTSGFYVVFNEAF